MKKLLLAALLVFSTASFAQPLVPQPVCNQGKLFYQYGQQHFWMDVCVNGLKADTPQKCDALYNQIGKEEYDRRIDAYLRKKVKEVCGK